MTTIWLTTILAQTIADVLRQLAEEEDELTWMQEGAADKYDNSPSEFIYAGIELEQQM